MAGISRRLALGGAAAFSGTIGMTRVGQAAAALGARAEQAPAFYRFMLGDMTVTTLSDGNLYLQPGVIATNAPEGELEELLRSNYAWDDTVPVQVSPTLIETNGERVLFDVGSGSRFQPSAGKLRVNLEAAGLQAQDIDRVVITHAHPDHCWGLTDGEGAPVFPNAEVLINDVEWSFWASQETVDQAPEQMRSMFETTQQVLRGIEGRVRKIKPDDEIVAGIKAIEAYGHTPGHTAFEVTSGEDRLMLSVDCFNHHLVTLMHPDWHFGFDMAPAEAVETRKRILGRVSEQGTWVIGYHMPWPALGQVADHAGTYRWVGANFVWSEEG